MRRVPFSAFVADHRAHKLNEELATDWGSLVVYRLPAFALAWALLPLGVTPNQLTFAGLAVIPAIALSAWFLPAGTAMAVVTVLALAFNVLDCADGSLARATGTSSLSGRYLDFAADVLYRNIAYASYGLIADRMWPGAAFPWLAVGLVCGLLVTYARVNRLYARKLFPGTETHGTPSRRRPSDLAFSFLSGLDTLLPLIALLAWAAGDLRLALLWFLIFTLGDAVIEVTSIYLKARRFDQASAGREPRED
ncbi:MAG: CDP-alcohol phosphatidyltransferase family protein [Hyphomicrobiales bacterium]